MVVHTVSQVMRIKSAIPMFLALLLGFIFGCTAPGSNSGGPPGGTHNNKAATYSGFSAQLISPVFYTLLCLKMHESRIVQFEKSGFSAM